MAKLIRVEFIRRENDEWMVFEKFEDGSERGGRRTNEAMRQLVEEMLGAENE